MLGGRAQVVQAGEQRRSALLGKTSLFLKMDGSLVPWTKDLQDGGGLVRCWIDSPELECGNALPNVRLPSLTPYSLGNGKLMAGEGSLCPYKDKLGRSGGVE